MCDLHTPRGKGPGLSAGEEGAEVEPPAHRLGFRAAVMLAEGFKDECAPRSKGVTESYQKH